MDMVPAGPEPGSGAETRRGIGARAWRKSSHARRFAATGLHRHSAARIHAPVPARVGDWTARPGSLPAWRVRIACGYERPDLAAHHAQRRAIFSGAGAG